jgi:flavin-dependent dehydrogenase
MSKPNLKLMEHVAIIAAETAVKAAIDYLEEDKKKEQQQKRDRRLRNTKLLLRNYRSFVLHCDELKSELDDLDDEEFMEDLQTDELAVEAIKKSKRRTLAMVRFIDKMFKVYAILSEDAGRPEELRQYKTVYYLYISQEKKTVEEIAECHNVVTRTVHRDIKEGVKTLTSLIFGVDGIRFVD